MNEEFLHFIWKYRLFDPQSLCTAEGDCIEVIRSGDPNPDAGPDFLNSRLKIGETVWAGNVEIHLRSSDWNRHHHDIDRAYENVILHLVHIDDTLVKDSSGRTVTTVAIRSDERLMQNYHALRNSTSWIACGEKLDSLDPFLLKQWLSRMLVERLEQKSGLVFQLLDKTNGDWQEVLYRMVFQAMGNRVNSAPFAMLAQSLPYRILLRHGENLFQLEALLFGQAGFLQEQLFEEEYFSALRKEYDFLKKKYGLKPMEEHLWKWLRLRPVNFPTIRIAQMAAVIHHHLIDFNLLSSTSITNLSPKFLDCAASEYWDKHYQFNKMSEGKKKKFGKEAVSILLINALVPVLFSWAEREKNQELKNYAMDQLETIDPEDNAVIRNWNQRGLRASHAFDSQALLQLHKFYCSQGHCLRCAIGAKLVTRIEN